MCCMLFFLFHNQPIKLTNEIGLNFVRFNQSAQLLSALGIFHPKRQMGLVQRERGGMSRVLTILRHCFGPLNLIFIAPYVLQW